MTNDEIKKGYKELILILEDKLNIIGEIKDQIRGLDYIGKGYIVEHDIYMISSSLVDYYLVSAFDALELEIFRIKRFIKLKEYTKEKYIKDKWRKRDELEKSR